MARRHTSVIVSSSRVGRSVRGAFGAALGASVLAGGTLAAAPGAMAITIPACVGETFTTTTASACTVEDGETVTFIVQSGTGGNGGNSWSGQLGGSGGLGYQVTGSYTNTSGSTQTLDVVVGAFGIAGANGGVGGNGANGSAGTDSGFSVSGGATIVTAGGGQGGAGGLQSGTGTAASGGNGSLVFPGSLEPGWTGTARFGLPRVAFPSPPTPTPDPESSGSSPAAVMQQFGAPTLGTCDETASTVLNWAGVSSGGWGRSWASWMNNGLGGDVCVRTLGYHSGGWSVLG